MYELRKARFAFSAAAALALLLTLAGPADAGTLTVETVSKHSGNYGLRVAPDATPAYVQSSHPSAEKTYRVRFYLNLTRLNLVGSFDVFAAYDGADPLPSAAPTGNAVLRAAVRQLGDGSKVLDVFTRTDSGETQLSTSPALANGWRHVELQWSAATAAGANNGFVNVWVNGVAQPSNLANLDSETQAINYARWGSVTGATTGTPYAGAGGVNSFRLDDFGSQRSGYLGQVQVFGDVPAGSNPFRFIQGLYSVEVTSGCGGGNYCPNDPVLREQMAVFLVRSTRGALFAPPAATGVFNDVATGSFFAPYIEQLAADGITTGCGGGNYCPSSPVTRAQMAIFLLRAKYGSGYTPPPATGTVFADVPAGLPAAPWIEQLAAEGITTGCGGGNYCPNDSVTRGQMAIFLVRTFSFPTQEVGP